MVQTFNYQFYDVIEFFESFQGEVPFVGTRSIFVRFKKCNYKCPYCDTYKVMSQNMGKVISMKEVCDELFYDDFHIITFTGGEPTLYRKQIITFLLNYIKPKFYDMIDNKKYVIIETNGSMIQEMFNDLEKHNLHSMIEHGILQFVISPKFYNEAVSHKAIDTINILQSQYKRYKHSIYLKIVADESSATHIDNFMKHLDDRFMNRRHIYIMFKGQTQEELLISSKFASTLANKYHVNISPRMHITYSFK